MPTRLGHWLSNVQVMTADSRSLTARQDRSGTVDCELLLELLGDEYACELLCALEDAPMNASELVDQCDMSRPTVYRRLKRLSRAGVVDSRQSAAADGQRRTEYYLVVDAVAFRIAPDGVTGAVPTDASDR